MLVEGGPAVDAAAAAVAAGPASWYAGLAYAVM